MEGVVRGGGDGEGGKEGEESQVLFKFLPVYFIFNCGIL